MDPIIEFDATGKIVNKFGKGEFNASTGIEANLCEGSEAPGNLYVSNSISSPSFVRAYGTNPIGCFKARTEPAESITETSATLTGTVNPSGLPVTECFFEFGTTTAYGQTTECDPTASELGEGEEPVAVHADLSGLTKGTVYHFRLTAKVGPETETGADEEFKTLGPPVVSGEQTVAASSTEATLKAFVNPEGFAATYHFEYTTKAAFDAEGFEGAQSTPSIAVGSDRSDHAVIANLKGLEPGTAYRWRVVASNSSGTTEGPDHAFKTYRPPAVDPCANEDLRAGPSALLPDCRAYEMVSPVDKNGGDILNGLSGASDPGGYMQVSPDGDKIAYATLFASFAGQPTNVKFNQYLAGRGVGGWSSEGIRPPIPGRLCCSELNFIAREFLAFSDDLCSAWLYDPQAPPLAGDAQDGVPNLYRRDNCGPGLGELETLTAPAPVPLGTPNAYVDYNSFQGLSKDGGHAVFLSRASLPPECRTATAAEAISYQWLRNGVPIPGATSRTYEFTEADAGKAIQCQVFAINANAGATQVANPASIVPPAPGVMPPVAPTAAIPAPGQSGPLTVGGPGGQTLTCNTNEINWQGSPVFSYQWYRNGVAIAGATSSTYVVSGADVATAAVFQCAVTGTNAGGSVTKVSNNRATAPAPSAPTAPSANASMGGSVMRIYDRFEGENHLVSVLPGGKADETLALVGTSPNLNNAVSEDGSRVYWTSSGEGKIYVRLHPEQGIVSGECTDNATVACTLQVSAGGARFWSAAPDGSKALYTEEGKLVEYSLLKAEAGEPPRRQVTGVGAEAVEARGVAGASDDLSRIYFVSNEVISGADQNSVGEEAQEDQPNLYLDEAGAKRFVATLVEGDVGEEEPGAPVLAYDLDSTAPYERATRVTPDGSRIVFNSRAELTGYDNADQDSGVESVEVFSYEASSGELRCVSCNPSGARPSGGRELRLPYRPTFELNNLTNVTAAAWIPTWEHPLHASNVMSEDGNRIFFNSNDALLPRDANGAQDVYEWEAPGTGSCDEEDANFFEENGGCIYLISSGESSYESEFWEASPDGDDVFFTTESSLVSQDPGSIDLYDARVGGGFPEPQAKVPCEGEACQSPPPAPEFPAPASGSYEGPPNPPPPSKKACPKGKRKVRKGGKVRCVKKKRTHKAKTNNKRRAAR